MIALTGGEVIKVILSVWLGLINESSALANQHSIATPAIMLVRLMDAPPHLKSWER